MYEVSDGVILNPNPNSYSTLKKIICRFSYVLFPLFWLICSSEGEHSVFPVTEKVWKRWERDNQDIKLPIQYRDEILTWINMKRPHDGAAGRITSSIVSSVRKSMAPDTWDELMLECHTGCSTHFNLVLMPVTPLISSAPRNKNADMCICTDQSGHGNYWPGVAVEVGYADSHVKSRRDTALWLDGSNGEVS